MLLAEPAMWDALAALQIPAVVAAVTQDQDLWSGFSSWQSLLFVIAALGEVLAVIFVYRVLVRGGSAASTLLWMAVILLTPWLGLLLYYLLPRRLQLRRLRRVKQREQRLRQVRPVDGAEPQNRELRVAPEVRRAGLEALLGSCGGLSEGNHLGWLPRGEDFFQAAAEAVRSAKRHVHCVVYILRPDETGLKFLELLTAAAARGVKVRLCFDSFGSWTLNSAHLQALRAAGGRAVPFLPLLWKRRPFTINLRNHRKLLIVDGDVAFVGGRNIADEYRHDRVGKGRRWYDAMMSVRGPAVDHLQEMFVQDWCTATDEVLADTYRPTCEPVGDSRVGVVGSGPDQEPSALWFAMVQAIGEAEVSIALSSPYLVLPPTLLFALQLAAARGVQVRIYTNGPRAEAAFLYHAQRHHYRQLLASGIEVFETIEEYNHTKFLVVDQRTVCIGSANMDLRSAQLNFELAVVAIDAAPLAQSIQTTIDERQAGFRRVTRQTLPRNPFWRAIDGACGVFSPLL